MICMFVSSSWELSFDLKNTREKERVGNVVGVLNF